MTLNVPLHSVLVDEMTLMMLVVSAPVQSVWYILLPSSASVRLRVDNVVPPPQPALYVPTAVVMLVNLMPPILHCIWLLDATALMPQVVIPDDGDVDDVVVAFTTVRGAVVVLVR